jgi:hypothetical protein
MSEIKELAAALVKIGAELKNPALDATNPHFKSKYPSLAGVRDTIAPVAAKHGVFIAQNLVTDERGVGCETILIHASGQQMKFGPLFLPASKADPQGFGSCATYARRYSLLAAFNVVGDEDDDANAGTAAHNNRPAVPAQRAEHARAQTIPPGARLASEKQIKLVRFRLDKSGASEMDLLAHLNVASLDKLPFNAVTPALEWIEKAARAQNGALSGPPDEQMPDSFYEGLAQ